MPIGFGASLGAGGGMMSSSKGMSGLFDLSLSKKSSSNMGQSVAKKLRSKK